MNPNIFMHFKYHEIRIGSFMVSFVIVKKTRLIVLFDERVIQQALITVTSGDAVSAQTLS